MKRFMLGVALAAAACLTHVEAFAANSKDQVVALMDEAVAHYKSVGAEQAVKDFADPKGGFIDGSLYVVVQKTDGGIVLHPMNAKLNGKNVIELKDMDGKEFVREQCDIAKKGEGWAEYKWVNPETKKIGEKVSLIKTVANDVFFTIGYFK
jgi:cytochrome c